MGDNSRHSPCGENNLTLCEINRMYVSDIEDCSTGSGSTRRPNESDTSSSEDFESNFDSDQDNSYVKAYCNK